MLYLSNDADGCPLPCIMRGGGGGGLLAERCHFFILHQPGPDQTARDDLEKASRHQGGEETEGKRQLLSTPLQSDWQHPHSESG